jgi:hypothetical protein
MSGFFLYFAWSGFVKSELTFLTHQGYVVEKIHENEVVDSGMNVMSHSIHHIKLSSGLLLPVSAFVYDSVQMGEKVVLAEKNNHVYLIEKHKLIY